MPQFHQHPLPVCKKSMHPECKIETTLPTAMLNCTATTKDGKTYAICQHTSPPARTQPSSVMPPPYREEYRAPVNRHDKSSFSPVNDTSILTSFGLVAVMGLAIVAQQFRK